MPISPSIISYANADQFAAHCETIGHDVAEYTDSDIEQALRRAAEYLDAIYGSRFIGEAATFGQSLAWPRKRAKFRGRFYPDNEIPEKIVTAVCELAFMSLSGTNDDQGAAVVENLLFGLIQPEQAGTVILGSIERG